MHVVSLEKQLRRKDLDMEVESITDDSSTNDYQTISGDEKYNTNKGKYMLSSISRKSESINSEDGSPTMKNEYKVLNPD